MQIKRLEEMLGQRLLERSGRGVVLTPAGEQLLGYAQKIINLNDEVYSRLTDTGWEGEIKLGVPVDIVYPGIPQVLKRMGRTHPRVKVQLFSSFTRVLKAQFAQGKMDVILTTESGVEHGGETLLDVPLRWIGAPDGQAWRQRPLRIAFARTCGFRDEALRRLDAAGQDWELAVDSDSDTTIDATVSADLAITARLDGHIAPYLAPIEGSGLPDLGMQKVNMYVGSGQPAITLALCNDIRQSMAAL
jgi:DNA-binding transcriptional LysR family regulator